MTKDVRKEIIRKEIKGAKEKEGRNTNLDVNCRSFVKVKVLHCRPEQALKAPGF